MQRILIVDDEATIHELVVLALERSNIDITSAQSLTEARERLASIDRLDAAVVDKNLPDGIGTDFIAELKEKHPFVECILITAYASLESAIAAVELGAFDYLTKPFDITALELRIINALDKSRLRREHAESELRYRRMFEGAADALLVCDADGVILDANPAAIELYGYPTSTLLGGSLEELISTGEVESGQPNVVWHQRADGSRFPAEVSINRIRLHDRDLLLRSVRDLSLRFQLEHQLRQSQKMGALGRLAGGVAHDFNNLLVIILSYADMLARGLPDGERHREFAEEIRGAAERGAALTRQLLSFSRKKPARVERLRINDAVQDMRALLERTIGEHITLSTGLDPRLWTVNADADHLGQILLNLAVNARDAMPGGGSLRLETINIAAPAARGRGLSLPDCSWVCLRVIDTGAGMTKEVASKIFEPFYTTRESGTGLGLSVVYGLVEQAGGVIQVDTEVGRGTTFEVFLPASDEAAEVATYEVEVVREMSAANETVLVVEDEGAVRFLIRRILSAAGYSVLEAGRGDEALQVAGDHGAIDALVTDVMMPGMSGRVLADEMLKSRPELPVLFISGYPTGSDGFDIGGQGESFLSKPFTKDALLRQLRDVIER